MPSGNETLQLELGHCSANPLNDPYTLMSKGLVTMARVLVGTTDTAIEDLDEDFITLDVAVLDLRFLDFTGI